MTISGTTATDVAQFINVDTSESVDMGIIANIIMPSARQHLIGYTGKTLDELDALPDLTFVFLCLCSQMFDNRSLVGDSAEANRVVESFLDKYGGNLL